MHGKFEADFRILRVWGREGGNDGGGGNGREKGQSDAILTGKTQ